MSELAVGEYHALAEGVYLEGLTYDFRRDVVWYSDVIKGGIHGVRPDGTPYASFNPERMWTGGIMMNACGAVFSTGQHGIMWNDPDTGESGWLLQEIDGVPLIGANEMWPDGTGGIYFGTNDIESIIAARDTRPTQIYRMAVDGTVTLVADRCYFPNGLAMDARRRRFYASDTFRTSWTWDVAPDHSLVNQRMLFDKDDCDGCCVEEDGNVLLTGFRSPGRIVRVTPEGKELAPLETPAGCTTQIRYGGADLRDYYINVVPADGGDTLKAGGELSGASTLYRGRAAVAGVACEAAAFKLR
ncbi:MAG: SMP-30/gluconolactonase/LRE family protein [Sphingomonadales bacterium]|nr:SMP-30/gluconolactonase/LRE family protein [Sphingomonadales bacterium]